MMKLFAFKEREEKETDKQKVRHHALDLYTILATITEAEWSEAIAFSKRLAEQEYLKRAGNIVETCFARLTAPGLIRLRENPYYRPEFQLDLFMSLLKELFPLR